ncbi:hypothetical protein [Neglectibacter caecimuris]|uniref:hypothetical protein n=1 Tax=Neglectibacter caecimuris TaxID=3093658 RepID=UPI002AC95922|nr:hypothetical protein [Neglectibacter sp. M00184]
MRDPLPLGTDCGKIADKERSFSALPPGIFRVLENAVFILVHFKAKFKEFPGKCQRKQEKNRELPP